MTVSVKFCVYFEVFLIYVKIRSGNQLHDDIFRNTAGLEIKLPVADAGGDNKIGVLSCVATVDLIVRAYPFPDIVDRNKLTSVGVAGKNKA